MGEMVARRLLTVEFVDSVSPPTRGELWIADTQIYGFGLRLWATANSSGAAYAIRVTNSKGRSVRKTYNPYEDFERNPFLRLGSQEGSFSTNGQIKLSFFLTYARSWARDEINKIKEIRSVWDEYLDMKAQVGKYIEEKKFGYLCDIVLNKKNYPIRGWSEDYADRLRHSLDKFDDETGVREMAVSDLADGRLTKMVASSALTPGNLRNFRSLLNVVLWNIHDLGGPPVGKLLPSSRGLRSRPFESILDEFSLEDFENIINSSRNIENNWRASICIELCFVFHAPITRVMQGRWRQIVENRWYPYSSVDRASWHHRWVRIEPRGLECLKRAALAAKKERLRSEHFFPSAVLVGKPISNIDRVWHSLLRELGLPKFSLRQCVNQYRCQLPISVWPNPSENRKIAAEMSKLVNGLDLTD